MKVRLSEEFIDTLQFDSQGLIPAIVQEVGSGTVLMLAYQNREALLKTLETGETWFYSRSRRELWHKGATSGHYQGVQAIYYDCDADTILLQVKQTGSACHEGYHTCFHNRVVAEGVAKEEQLPLNKEQSLGIILGELAELIKQRKIDLPEESYTTYLFQKGLDKILKKVGEESAEVIIAAKNENKAEVVYEISDLIYHLLVLMAERDVELGEIAEELGKRRK